MRYASAIDECKSVNDVILLDLLAKRAMTNEEYELSNWREIVSPGEITSDFHFGQVLGLGSFGLIREAVYISEVKAF